MKMPKSFRAVALSALAVLCLSGNKCDSGKLFQDIGPTNLAAPTALAVDPAKARAYVINSNNTVEFTSTHFMILDLTDPAAPTILNNPANPIPMQNFSGQIYYDAPNGLVYTPNRFSENVTITTDHLLRINVDEASSTFGQLDTFDDGENPFGINCCDSQGRIFVIDAGGRGVGMITAYNPADLSSPVQLSLELHLSSGEDFQGQSSTEGTVVVNGGNQLYVSNRNGRVYVINMDEVGDTTKNPIDYILLSDNSGRDFRGIASVGTTLYVVDGKRDQEVLRIVDISSVPAVAVDTSLTNEVDMFGIESDAVAIGHNPQEVVVYKGIAYVTNFDDNTVSVIDASQATPITTIAVGNQPFGMAAFNMGGKDYLYVTNTADDSISIIDIASNTVINTFKP